MRIFPVYRTLAYVVGVLLTILVFVMMPLKYLTPDGTGTQHWGEVGAYFLGVGHGWLYMGYLVAAFVLSRRARWDWPFTLLTLLAGTVPILIFYVERRVEARVRAEAPELL